MTDAALTPDWLPWAAGLAWAASAAVAVSLADRWRRGLALVARSPRDEVRWEGGDVLVVVLLSLACMAAMGGLVGREPPLDRLLAANLLATSVAAMLAIGWLVSRGATPADLGFVAGQPARDLRLALGGLALVLAPLLALAAALHTLVPYEHQVVELLSGRRDPWVVGLVIAAAVVAAPLVEELFFRRILQGWLEARLPEADGAVAITISAAAFALAHYGQGLAYVPLFPLGLVLGFIARRTGSIVPCILLHALFNAVSVALLLATPAAAPSELPAGQPLTRVRPAAKPLWPPEASAATIRPPQDAA
jgi:membrane protease YdiL (CAAX protease family)